MTSLRDKVYDSNGILRDLTDLSVINVKSGKDNENLLNVIRYNSDVDSSSLYELTKDLIENDQKINHEKNAVNSLIDEGVLSIYDALFEFSYVYDSETSKNVITITKGNLKINVSSDTIGDINNIFTINSSTTLDIININTLSYNWYRRDLIVLVFYDADESKTTPYIMNIPGVETDIPDIPYSLNDRKYDAEIGYYPLYQVLYKNEAGVTTYVSHSRVYEYAGFKAIIDLSSELLEQYIDDDNNVVNGLYRIRANKFVHLSKEDGELLTVEYGQSNESYEIDGGSRSIEKNEILTQEPDIGLQISIADGGILNFPFKFVLDPNQYFPRDNVKLSNITVAVLNYANEDDWPAEGLELYIQTAKYYTTANNNGILNITAVTSINSGAATVLTLSNGVSYLTKLTFDNQTFTNVENEVQAGYNGDFILIVDGKGKYQISRIINKLSDTQIVINALPLGIDETSKIMIFNTESIVLAGDDISDGLDGSESSFFNDMSDVDKNEYKYIYKNSTNTAISKIQWDIRPEFTFTNVEISPVVLDANHDYFELPYPVKIDESDDYFITSIYSKADENSETRINYVSYINKTLSDDKKIVLNISLPVDSENNHSYAVQVTFVSAKSSLKYFFEKDNSDDDARLYTIPENTVPSIKSTEVLSNGYNFSDENAAGFIISLKQNDITLCEKEILLDDESLNVEQIVSQITAKFSENNDITSYLEVINESDLTISFAAKSAYAGSEFKIVLASTTTEGYSNALTILGFNSGTYTGEDSFIGYVKVDFQFKLNVNYRQWYFIQPSVYDDAKPLTEFGKRPEVVTINPNSGADMFDTYLSILCSTTEGKYPEDFNGTQIISIQDLYGEISNYSNTRGNVYGETKKVAKYMIQSRCLTEEFKDYRIPTHRDSDSDIAICYFDIIYGLISFNPGSSSDLDEQDSEIPDNLKITCSFNNVFNGTIDWSDITGRPDDYASVKELVIEAITAGQKTFDLGYYPPSKASLNIDINGKMLSSGDFDLIDGGNKLLLINYACEIGERVHIKGNAATRSISIQENAVTTSTISDAAVTTAKIADGAVTTSKLASEIGIDSAKVNIFKLYNKSFFSFVNYDDETVYADQPFAILKFGPPTKENTEVTLKNATFNTYSDLNKRHFYVFDTDGKRFNIYFGVLHGSETEEDIVDENPANGVEYSLLATFNNYEQGTDASTTTFHNTWFEINTKTAGGTQKYTIIFRANGLDATLIPGDVSATKINIIYDFPTEGNIYNGSKDDLASKLTSKLNQLGVCPEVIATLLTNGKVKIDYQYKGYVDDVYTSGNLSNIYLNSLLDGHDGYTVNSDNINIPIIISESDSAEIIAATMTAILNSNISFMTSFIASHVVDSEIVNIECLNVGTADNVVNVNTTLDISAKTQGLYGDSPTNETIIEYGKFEIDQIFANTRINSANVELNNLVAKESNIVLKIGSNKIGEIYSMSSFDPLSNLSDCSSAIGLKIPKIGASSIITNDIQANIIKTKKEILSYYDSVELHYDYSLGVIEYSNYSQTSGNKIVMAALELSTDDKIKTTAAKSIVDGGYSATFNNPNNSGTNITKTVNSKFIAHMIYNAVWNDIAECVPSDGSSKPGDLLCVDVFYDKFRVTKLEGNKKGFLGIHSEHPGFIVGYNDKYENPINIALKGMVKISVDYFYCTPVVGDRIYLINNKIYNEYALKQILRESISPAIFMLDVIEIGTIIEVSNYIKIFLK